MGERIQHVAMIIFALALVALLAMMNGTIHDIGGSVSDKLSRSYASTDTVELDAFDNTRINGETVINAIRSYNNIYKHELRISVTNNGSTYTYGTNCDYDSYDVTDPDNVRYIDPDSVYTATLVKNTNDIITTIEFIKE